MILDAVPFVLSPHQGQRPLSWSHGDNTNPTPLSLTPPPCPPIGELGASFFFAKYTFNEHPYANDYHDWLLESYSSEGDALSAVIQAVGIAGISNVSYTPHIVAKSNEQYCKALSAVNEALCDPTRAITDTMLMSVILLGWFEVNRPLSTQTAEAPANQEQTVKFESQNRYQFWETHVKGTMALLELRGKEQFARPRGGLLFVLARSQIVSYMFSACLYMLDDLTCRSSWHASTRKCPFL